jgi:hypothetical protein
VGVDEDTIEGARAQMEEVEKRSQVEEHKARKKEQEDAAVLRLVRGVRGQHQSVLCDDAAALLLLCSCCSAGMCLLRSAVYLLHRWHVAGAVPAVYLPCSCRAAALYLPCSCLVAAVQLPRVPATPWSHVHKCTAHNGLGCGAGGG